MVQLRYEMSTGKKYESQCERRKVPLPKPIHDQLGTLKAKTLILWGNNDGGAAVVRALPLFQLI
ncbi:MAG: hypothetical protein V3T23_10300, partial [Nitrososphaerales archaeon]